jgi:hypothetical protein
LKQKLIESHEKIINSIDGRNRDSSELDFDEEFMQEHAEEI